MSKHTPGPWSYSLDYTEINAEAGNVVIDHLMRPDNARLIAAAPTMLDTLRQVLGVFGKPNPDPLVAFAMTERIRAAIQQATGELT